MKTLVLSLEYGAEPIWIYNDDYMIDCNDIPDEWEEDESLDKRKLLSNLDELQNLYESGFIDTERIFDFVGFQGNQEKMNRLLTLLDEIRAFIKEHLPDGYVFEDRVITHNELEGF